MKFTALKTIAAAAALTTALVGSASAASIGAATINASALNMRSSASTDSSILTTVPRGNVVVVGEKTTYQWYKVVYKGAVGYMNAEYLTFSESLEGSFGTGTVHGSDVRMRKGPSLNDEILGTYQNGTQMTVTGVHADWYRVSYNGVTGYIYSNYFALNGGVSGLTAADADYSAAPVTTKGDEIVATAMQYLGVPYVWAGTSPSGFDCSGLVYYTYKQNGYSINRTAASIYTNGVAVDRTALQTGDAICFYNGSYSYIGHVGIYIGNNQFIHASSSDGQVRIDSLDTKYYDSHYAGARRIV